ncbi:MAG: adenylyltransferase/cytidyltransferase family protein, partial [Lachnospiraceae bacterium]|nr:adenylyltransferase/cytidyltransferase family protein [Lachnospiraceae bacterium]
MESKKIMTAEAFSVLREQLRVEGKKVVMCHGVYDLLHYGHIEHLKEAKSLGDVLVVSVTAAKYVNKGPDRPYYNDIQRTEFLASIEFVDYVVLSQEGSALTNIKLIKPDIFVKGQEFQSGSDGITGNVAKEIDMVKSLGGDVHFTQGEVHSSSKLLNNYFNALPDEVVEIAKSIINKYGGNIFETICNYVDGFDNLKVLVVGDIIIDEYVFCQVQGLTNKDAVISARYEDEEKYLGGALAIARHISNFCHNTSLLSMMGSQDKLLKE